MVVRTNVTGRSLDCAGDVIPRRASGRWSATSRGVPPPHTRRATGWPNAWAIEIAKRIPVGGGLGGGSADAGAVLRCLNALAPHPLSRVPCSRSRRALGADVPFLVDRRATGTRLGSRRAAAYVARFAGRDVALVAFHSVSDADAYAWLDDGEATIWPPAQRR